MSCIRIVTLAVLVGLAAAPLHADELWVQPTYQQDMGGLGVGSNAAWPVTARGTVRLAWGVPNDYESFQATKLLLIPHGPGGNATLFVYVCTAAHGDLAGAACAGPFPHAFVGANNRLQEIDISSVVGPRVGAAGQSYIAILAFTSPTTATDRIVGLRFAYGPKAPGGVASLAANTFSGVQTAPAFVGDGSALANVNANFLNGFDAAAFAAAGHVHGDVQARMDTLEAQLAALGRPSAAIFLYTGAPQTFTVPEGVTRVWVEAWGGGGGGGTGADHRFAGSGGGGGYARGLIDVTPGEELVVIVGGGGGGGTESAPGAGGFGGGTPGGHYHLGSGGGGGGGTSLARDSVVQLVAGGGCGGRGNGISGGAGGGDVGCAPHATATDRDGTGGLFGGPGLIGGGAGGTGLEHGEGSSGGAGGGFGGPGGGRAVEGVLIMDGGVAGGGGRLANDFNAPGGNGAPGLMKITMF